MERVISQWRSCLCPSRLHSGTCVLNTLVGPAWPGALPLPHLESASGRLRSQEVLTLHGSLPGAWSPQERGRGRGTGGENRCPLLPPHPPAPQAAAGPEGGGGACSPGSPLPQAWELLGYPPPWADPQHPGWGGAALRDSGKEEKPVQGGPWWSGRGGEVGPLTTSTPSLGGRLPWNQQTGRVSRPPARSPRDGGGPPGSQSRFPRTSGGRGGPSSLLALSFDVPDAAAMSEGDNTSELKITIAST